MRYEDLHDVEIGDILKFKETGDEFEVIEIDLDARFTPVRVAMTSDYATTELVSGILDSDQFDKSYKQWLYVNPEALQDQVPLYKNIIDADNLITLDRLELAPLAEFTEPVKPAKSAKTETLTASKAAEITKQRLVDEVLKRVEQTVSNEIGVFEIKVQDLDPITEDLEALGYRVRLSMKDDESAISWDPNY